MQLCFVMVDCSAFQNENEGQVCFHWGVLAGGVSVCLSNPAPHDLLTGSWTPKSGRATFHLLSYMPPTKTKHICCVVQQRTWNKRDPSADPQNLCARVTLLSLQMIVFNRTPWKPKDNCVLFLLFFSPSPARTIVTEVLFMRFCLAFRNNISLSPTIEDIPHVVINWISSLSLT